MTDHHTGAAIAGDGYVLTGNADLSESCTWSPPPPTDPDDTSKRPPLPGHEHAAALASIELNHWSPR